ncbi:MAG: hypothetical protein JJU29_08425 [Verrucomicrobia bacterium]|nr:hypothetical protein [Verrucomicrobiota bacterium]MCH8512123.1 hypothetical protein [Kiritimatiellia bacterium]
MHKIILALVLGIVLLAGCGVHQKTPHPSGRLELPEAGFSYVTPDGWYRTKLMGIDHIIVSGPADYGIEPNLFVRFVKPASDKSMKEEMLEIYKQNQNEYEVEQEEDFATDAGLQGTKITARHTSKDALPLAKFHYVFQDGDRLIGITATCASPRKERYEPIFDAAMKSLQIE